jgi:hypothetical protein
MELQKTSVTGVRRRFLNPCRTDSACHSLDYAFKMLCCLLAQFGMKQRGKGKARSLWPKPTFYRTLKSISTFSGGPVRLACVILVACLERPSLRSKVVIFVEPPCLNILFFKKPSPW